MKFENTCIEFLERTVFISGIGDCQSNSFEIYFSSAVISMMLKLKAKCFKNFSKLLKSGAQFNKTDKMH